MGRHLLAAVVVVVDTVLLVAGHREGLPPWGAPAYAMAVVLVVALRHRSPATAFTAALVLSALTGGAYVLLLWSAYHAGREVVSRRGTAVIVGSAFGMALGSVAVQLWSPSGDPRRIAGLLSVYGVFVALPMLTGRYLAQHERLVSALSRRNRQLGLERELLAEQERLRIARDMHDSLGHRLSLVSVQAAALEVSALPAEQRQAVRRLAGAARGAMDELHELVGTLRGEPETPDRSFAVQAIGTVVEEFRRSGAAVTLRQSGEPRPLSSAAGQAAYRVVEEGLTNAAKHASGQPVTVSVDWESDALLLTVANPLPDGPDSGEGGHGLAGLGERVRPVGGVLDHRLSGDGFRLFAMLPVTLEEEAADGEDLTATGRVHTAAVGIAVAALTFVLLPAGMLTGVRG
ncbi:histidine kinase [Streptosporangium sp. NBC_01639]|uniref:sensor histidine kinase n=1 Tax=Streptosporangium sp. NBC_01639 TaxID=2975948 RepID=UPI0038654352|nr:histidine kinase [Streptosporangium sp. NBC_01639]